MCAKHALITYGQHQTAKPSEKTSQSPVPRKETSQSPVPRKETESMVAILIDGGLHSVKENKNKYNKFIRILKDYGLQDLVDTIEGTCSVDQHVQYSNVERMHTCI